MMNIALVTPRYPPTHAGGGEVSARLLAEQLQSRNIADVTVYAFDGRTEETVGNVSVRRLADLPQYPYTLPNEIAYRKLRDIDLDCDVMHAYNMHLHPAVGRLSTHSEFSTIATLNAYPLIDWADIGISPTLQRKLYENTLLRLESRRLKRQMREIDLFLPLSSAVEKVYRKHGFQDADYRVVPNMLDPEFDVPAESAAEANQTKLLYVGYLRESKGVQHLVDTMDHLPSAFELTIVGDGPKQNDLESQAMKSDASNRIKFVGSIPYDEVTQAYADADIFVHPGVWPEPFGRTILEAMQAGLPVVATDVGGPAEIVPQRDLLCPPADPAAMAECIKYANKRRAEIGSENERIVSEQYHPDVVISQFQSAYEYILEEP